MQDIADTGCYFVIRSYVSGDSKYYTVDDLFVDSEMSIVIYHDEASAAEKTGGVNLRISRPNRDEEFRIKDCSVYGYDCTPEADSVDL